MPQLSGCRPAAAASAELPAVSPAPFIQVRCAAGLWLEATSGRDAPGVLSRLMNRPRDQLQKSVELDVVPGELLVAAVRTRHLDAACHVGGGVATEPAHPAREPGVGVVEMRLPTATEEDVSRHHHLSASTAGELDDEVGEVGVAVPEGDWPIV